MSDLAELRTRFRTLHESGTFLMPNAWDVGSALLFQSQGFAAVATTSSGLAATLGRLDQNVSFEELARHVADLTRALGIPLSVDAEDGYSADLGGLESTVEVLAGAGAAGISIEDYRPETGLFDPAIATDRVGRYVEVASRHGMTVTARAENHLYGVDDLDDTIDRLRAYAGAGAHVAYAPGLVSAESLQSVVTAVPAPVNALLLPGGPGVDEMRDIGVRRLSTGGALAWVAYGAAYRAARELAEAGTQDYSTGMLPADTRNRVFES